MAMTKERAGFHNLFAQIPDVLWEALCREADATDGQSVAGVLARVLAKHYRIPLGDLPKGRKPGRPPKRRQT
jgi:hypothetical protein